MISFTRLSRRLPPAQLFHQQITHLSAYRHSAPSYVRSFSWTSLASSPSLLVAQDTSDWDRPSEIDRVRSSMRLPIKQVLPSLGSDELLRSVFVKGLGLGGGGGKACTPEEDVFQNAYHKEKLEWLGDRLHNATVAEVLFVLGPVKRVDHSRLGWVQTRLQILTSNRFMEHLCKTYSFQSHGQKHPSPSFGTYVYSKYTHAPGKDFDEILADHWEAYIAALWVSRGHRAVQEFLAPLVYQAVMQMEDVWLDCLPNLEITEGVPSKIEKNQVSTPPKALQAPARLLPAPTPTPTPSPPPSPLPIRPPTLFTSSAKIASSTTLNLHFKNHEDAIEHLGDRLRAANSEHFLFNTGTHWTFQTPKGKASVRLKPQLTTFVIKKTLIWLATRDHLITLDTPKSKSQTSSASGSPEVVPSRPPKSASPPPSSRRSPTSPPENLSARITELRERSKDAKLLLDNEPPLDDPSSPSTSSPLSSPSNPPQPTTLPPLPPPIQPLHQSSINPNARPHFVDSGEGPALVGGRPFSFPDRHTAGAHLWEFLNVSDIGDTVRRNPQLLQVTVQYPGLPKVVQDLSSQFPIQRRTVREYGIFRRAGAKVAVDVGIEQGWITIGNVSGPNCGEHPLSWQSRLSFLHKHRDETRRKAAGIPTRTSRVYRADSTGPDDVPSTDPGTSSSSPIHASGATDAPLSRPSSIDIDSSHIPNPHSAPIVPDLPEDPSPTTSSDTAVTSTEDGLFDVSSMTSRPTATSPEESKAEEVTETPVEMFTDEDRLAALTMPILWDVILGKEDLEKGTDQK